MDVSFWNVDLSVLLSASFTFKRREGGEREKTNEELNIVLNVEPALHPSLKFIKGYKNKSRANCRADCHASLPFHFKTEKNFA
jgi:hypothetical protein